MLHASPPPPSDSSTAAGAVTFLIAIEGAQRAVARKLEWLAVAEPELERTAKAAFWLANRIRGDRLALR